ncbi:MAG TPA: hypothetical protein VM575_01135 [Nocardioides sp.]|nr:hypothetical protein [Nocardioides sp.]
MPRPFRTLVTTLVTTLVALLALVPAVAAAGASRGLPLEDYAAYQPATRCAPAAKPGTLVLARWTVNRYGGRFGGISRACGGSRSEHQEGRAFDWSVDVRRPADRARVARLMRDLFATNAAGEADALARRMGIMYLIWNDRIWSAWDGFEPHPYRSSSCPALRRCSRTLRHLDHVHISLTRGAAVGHTSWFVGRL